MCGEAMKRWVKKEKGEDEEEVDEDDREIESGIWVKNGRKNMWGWKRQELAETAELVAVCT